MGGTLIYTDGVVADDSVEEVVHKITSCSSGKHCCFGQSAQVLLSNRDNISLYIVPSRTWRGQYTISVQQGQHIFNTMCSQLVNLRR